MTKWSPGLIASVLKYWQLGYSRAEILKAHNVSGYDKITSILVEAGIPREDLKRPAKFKRVMATKPKPKTATGCPGCECVTCQCGLSGWYLKLDINYPSGVKYNKWKPDGTPAPKVNLKFRGELTKPKYRKCIKGGDARQVK